VVRRGWGLATGRPSEQHNWIRGSCKWDADLHHLWIALPLFYIKGKVDSPQKSPGWRISVGLVTFAIFAGCGSSQEWPVLTEHPPSGRDAISMHLPIVQHVETKLRRSFSLLDTAPEGLPADVRAVIPASTYGINFAFAQRIPIRSQRGFWVIPGDGFLCIVSKEADGSIGQVCAPTSVVIKHGLASVVIDGQMHQDPPTRIIVGIADDRSQRVRILTGHLTRSAIVDDNVFLLRDKNRQPPDRLQPLLRSRKPRVSAARAIRSVRTCAGRSSTGRFCRSG
jgi:hypothetical protein